MLAWLEPWATSSSVIWTSDAEVGEALEVGLVVAGERGAQVGLEADAVDGDAARLEVADHVVDAGALGVDPVGVVVVVAELGVGVGGVARRGRRPRSSRCRCAGGWSRGRPPELPSAKASLTTSQEWILPR